jgi:hypothetical protein
MKVSSGQTRFTNFMIRCKIIYTGFRRCHEFLSGRFSPTGKDNIAACISTGQQCDFEAVLITTKNKEDGCVPLVMLNL